MRQKLSELPVQLPLFLESLSIVGLHASLRSCINADDVRSNPVLSPSCFVVAQDLGFDAGAGSDLQRGVYECPML
jgi:hypothetical protein